MASKKAAAEPRNGVSAQREVMAEREHAADKRDRLADERERKANEREALADERQHKADEREALADERERKADERQREMDERERDLYERGRALGSAVAALEQRVLETIERSRTLRAPSAERLGRAEAAVSRDEAWHLRQQAGIDRASAESERGLATLLPDPGKPMERAEALRKQARAAIEAFAANEEEIARIHEVLAAKRPERRNEYRRTAEHARETARRAHEVLRTFTD